MQRRFLAVSLFPLFPLFLLFPLFPLFLVLVLVLSIAVLVLAGILGKRLCPLAQRVSVTTTREALDIEPLMVESRFVHRPHIEYEYRAAPRVRVRARARTAAVTAFRSIAFCAK